MPSARTSERRAPVAGGRKRSVTIGGHRTSYTLEDAFYSELERLAEETGITVTALVGAIDAARPEGANLSSAIRLHILARLTKARDSADPVGKARSPLA